MATIIERIGKNGLKTYRVSVRLKGHSPRERSFGDYETAAIWGKYQEMVIREKERFGAKDEELYTIQDVLQAKYGSENREYTGTIGYFKDIMDRPLAEIDYEILKNQAEQILDTEIKVRGNLKNDNAGVKKRPEINTVIRKFAHLSAAINHMVKNGADLTNHAGNVVKYLKNTAATNSKVADK